MLSLLEAVIAHYKNHVLCNPIWEIRVVIQLVLTKTKHCTWSSNYLLKDSNCVGSNIYLIKTLISMKLWFNDKLIDYKLLLLAFLIILNTYQPNLTCNIASQAKKVISDLNTNI